MKGLAQNCLARIANKYVKMRLRKQGSHDNVRVVCIVKRYVRAGLTDRASVVSDAGRNDGLPSSTTTASGPAAEVRVGRYVKTGYG